MYKKHGIIEKEIGLDYGVSEWVKEFVNWKMGNEELV